ncbi:hypothetical protein PCCS19_39060 [Paenibacillus sp. CCS19]|uniref:hypothetical protein n=1 Tax=Paenibacillus sp. CCS19 TaxID=3158387 RepID=UPI002564AE45|nr:hypothetical protein [Paenibacillus cellulosilyticus]GMK40850.1 hypothetical protein PCCS19_39060 [Paenibacillus cellulosilyticus]
MRPEQEQELIRTKLEEELGELRFLRSAEVVARTHPRSMWTRLRALWNYELELPLIPIGASFALLIAIVFVAQLQEKAEHSEPTKDVPRAERQLVEAGGNTYWKDDYEKAVNDVEIKNQS